MKNLRNESDLAEIRRRLRQVQPESPRCWGSMTAHQMICHLADSFRMVTGMKPATPAGRAYKMLKGFALYIPLLWPRGVATRPELDQKKGGTPPAEFRADVQALADLLDRFVQLPRDYQFQSHPMFGEMRESEWMRWGYLHMDHHFRQFGV